MATGLTLEIELKCLSDGSQTHRTLLFAPTPDTVADIKRRIENELSVPKSSQNLFLSDGQALLDSQRLASLYLRSGDTLRVEYFAKADVEQLRNDIDCSLRPTLEFLRTSSKRKIYGKFLQMRREYEALLSSCQSSLHDVALKRLRPWNHARTEANRRYLIQEGGLDVVLGIYAILVPIHWNSRDHSLQNLEISCLSFLWNFSETAYARQLIVGKGGFDMMLKSLMHYSEEEFLKEYSMHDIFDVATGCVSK